MHKFIAVPIISILWQSACVPERLNHQSFPEKSTAVLMMTKHQEQKLMVADSEENSGYDSMGSVLADFHALPIDRFSIQSRNGEKMDMVLLSFTSLGEANMALETLQKHPMVLSVLPGSESSSDNLTLYDAMAEVHERNPDLDLVEILGEAAK